jgi:ZIP family zinc transporter
MTAVIAAGLWGLLGGAALVLGALIGLLGSIRTRVIALVMAFGAGVLISALAFELTADAYDAAGGRSVVLGLLAGALVFYAGDWVLDHRGGRNRKRSGGQQATGAAGAIVLGALLDGIPESVAIGVSLIGGGTVGATVVAAVFLSNVPESLSATTGLRKAGHSPRWVLTLWTGVALLSGLAAAVGYVTLGGAGAATIATIESFAAGAILTMLSDTMMPEAFEGGGSMVGLVTTAGFTLAFLLHAA